MPVGGGGGRRTWGCVVAVSDCIIGGAPSLAAGRTGCRGRRHGREVAGDPEQPTWPAVRPLPMRRHLTLTRRSLPTAGAGAAGPAGPRGRLPRRPVGAGAARRALRLHARPPHARGGHCGLWHGCACGGVGLCALWDAGLRMGAAGWAAQAAALCGLTCSPSVPLSLLLCLPGIDKGNVRHVYQ